MATPDEIPTDLTLEIGENLPPDRFMAAARAFFGYVQEVVESVGPGADEVQWIVKLREGSHLVGVAPKQAVPPAGVLATVYNKAEKGLQMLAQGRAAEAGLSDAALRHLRVLSDMTDANNGKPVDVRFWIRRRPVTVNPEMARAVRDDARVAFNDYGSLEGKLRTIQDNGTLQVLLKDDLLGWSLRCYVSDDLLPKVLSSFRKRVEVTGLVHYRANGTPISIAAEHIDELPDGTELPSIDDVRGLLREAV